MVNGIYGEDFVSRIQGAPAVNWSDPHARLLKAAATIKHYMACVMPLHHSLIRHII